jgi:hypothetical protein
MYSFGERTNPMYKAVGVVILIWAMLMTFYFMAKNARAEEPSNEVHTKAGQLWGCHVPELDATVLNKSVHNRRGRDIMVVRVDRNHDGEVDAVLVYGSLGTGWTPFPIEYAYDIGYTGQPNKAYTDEMGNGICGQMREVDVKKVFSEPQPEAEEGMQCEAEDPKNPKKEL